MIKEGDIGFCFHRGNILSKMIKGVMGSKWSHNFIVLDENYVIETTSYKVQVWELKNYLESTEHDVMIFSTTLSPKERYDIQMEAIRHINEVYGYLQLISFGLRRLLMRCGIKIPNFFRQGLICSAIVLYPYSKTNNKLLSKIDPESLDTEEVFQLVSNSPDFECVFKRGNV
jgi:hypothetical protein